MAVTDDFTSSELDLNGQVNITSPTALVWGPDGRLYVTEVDGDIKVLDVSFGDKDPTDGDPNAQFYVTAAEVIADVKSIPNYNDDGTQASGTQRQVTGIDVTKQYDADGNQVFIDGQPAVVMYVTSSDSRIGAGGGGADLGLDTNSGTITRLVQTDTGWEVTDLVRGLGRSEENHATNGLEVIQELDGDGKLVSERLIVANGGNANTGAPSNNFAGQQEQPYSAAILEVDLDQLNEMAVQVDSAGRSYIYNLPTLDDPTRDGTDDNNDPFGGNDGVNSAKLTADSPVQIYSAGYRNAYDVEVTEDGRVWTYDNGANNNWGGRPAGEDEDGDVDAQEPENGTPDGYIATNLPVEDNTEIEGNFNPANWDQLHEVTRSDDLEGRTLSAGLGGAQTYTWNHPDLGELELVYGGHPNPTRAEGARAGILYSPSSGTQNSLLMVSNVDKGAGTSDFLEVVAWLEEIGYSDAFINSTVVAVDPGVRYSETFIAGFGIDSPTGRPATTGVFSLVEDLDGPVGLPSDIDEIVHALNPIEGNYLEAGFTDGALDTGKGSINGLAEYTSTIFDDADASLTMQGALIASVFNGNDYLIIGRDTDGIVQTGTQGGRTVAAEKEVVESGGAPLGVASIGDDLIPHGGEVAFRGSIWGAIYKQNGPVIEILQPGNADNNALLPVYAGQEPSDPTDNDLDGVDHVADPFEYSQTNGYALGVGEKLVLDFDQVNINPEFSGSLGDSGILGAALDGSTPNRDAKTEDDGFTDPEDLEDGLFDNGGNIIPGGNAPILQIKKVKEGTMVGAANTVRDALHTGVNFDADVQRLVASVEIANWAAEQFSNEGRVSGLTFGDGTQSNFIRFVFGDVGSSLGLEVGVEVNDQYTVLGTTTDQNFIDQLTVGNATLLGQKQVLLELEISDIGGDYNLRASYRVVDTNGDVDAEGSIDFGTNGAQVPEGVLRDVLDGTHTVSDGDTEAPSGAAIGIVAEKGTATDFETVDINVINIEAFGNEIQATTAQDVGAAGTAGEDTIIYTGTETNLAALDPSVENFDGTGSSANYDVTGNALDNTIAVGSGTNTISTGDGEDLVRGDLSDLAGDTLSDFSIEDKLLLEDLAGLDPSTITYQAGSAIMTINGQTITFDGDEFTDFDASLGSEFFSFENTEEGLLITLTPPETVIYRVNAGSSAGPAATQGTIAALDDGPDWLGDADLIGPNATGVTVTLGGANNTFTNGQTNAEAEIDSGNVDLSIVPWEVFAAERSDNSSGNAKLTYDFDVIEGQTYKVTLFYTENWPGIFEFADVSGSSRQFDVALEGSIPTEFEDLNPAQEAATLLGLGTVSDDMSDTDKAAILGTAFQREATYTATDDLLTLEFEHDVENPKINAIQVTLLGRALDDSIPPVIQEITVSNDQGDSDSPRTATVVVVDAGGFDIATVANLSPTFAGIEPSAVGAPQVSVSSDGLTATITYELSAPASGWPTDALGQINLADGAFEDAAGNASAQASEEFYINPFLSQLDRGAVVRAINIGTTDTTEATGLDADPLDGGAVDNNRYGGAIAADSIILDAFGNPIEFEADNNAFHTSSKSTTALNNNVDGELGSTGSNSGGVDIDGSAYHTYRDSNAATWTSTFDGFANGAYIVELHFAELFHGTAAQRVGDFTVNGVVFGNDYDAYVEGGNSADAPSFVRLPVIVTDGTIEVEVNSSDGQAGYSAIVVYDAVDPNLPPSISVADVVVGEDDGDAIITFTRDGDLSEDITINFSVSGDTADASDFGTASPSPITILAGQTTATATLPITDDDEQENAETITVTINNVTNASADATISDGTATITIAASDSPFQAPVGNTIFELDFEGVSGEPTAVGGFDGALGGVENIVDEDAEVVDGQLVVQTSEGDINDGTDDGSQNDFTKTVDLSDPSLTEVYLSTRFDNPFTEDLLTSQGVTDGVIPSFVQQGIVFGTGSQLTGEMVKLVWGGVANGTGSQLWTKGGTPNQPVTFDSMVENGTTLFDVASVELSLAIDRANGTVGQYVTLFNEAGDMIGGVRPEAETGFATAAPVDLPPAVLANLNSSTDLTHVGVTSSDNSSPIGSFTSFEVKWDTLLLSSPQFVEPTGAIDTVNGVAVSGEDFSDDHLAPTDIGTLAEGETTIVATQQGDNAPGGRERDYFTFTVADGQQLTGIILEGFETDEQGTPQAFIGINDTGQIPTDPVTFENVEQMLGGYVYNSGDVVNQATSNDGNLLDELGDGSEFDGPQEILFRGGEGFEGPLPAGTYTIWLNQGGDASTATLKLVTEPVAQVELSVAAPAPVEEAGDVGVTTIDFVVTADDATFSGTVDVTFDTTSAIDQNQQLTFVDGVATLSVDFANDDVDDGDSAVGVTLTGASPTSGNTEFTISDSADTATATVTEDDATRFLRGEVVFAINAGGPALNFDGIDFSAGTGADDGAPFGGGSQFTDGNGGNGQQSVFDDTVYETEINGDQDGDFTFSTASGIDPEKLYYVDLYLAEIFASFPGERLFNVFVEDEVNPTVENFDILDTTGDFNTPIVLQLQEPISPGANGAIDLSFVAVTDRAKISGIVIREAVPIDDDVVLISVSDVTVDESASEVLITFTRTGNDSEDVTVEFSSADGTATDGFDYTAVSGSVIVPAAGDGTVTVSIPLTDDLIAEGDETFSVSIDNATAPTKPVTVEQAVATVTISDDDAIDPLDIDGDGILNTDDPFAYDSFNGKATVLSDGGSFRQDFDTDTADVFSADGGFTGILVNPAFDPAGISEADPYGDRTTEATSLIEGGVLKVESSETDTFGGGTGANNTIKDNYQRAADVSGVTGFTVEAKALNPFSTPLGGAFASLGITMGAGGVDDAVKLVFGNVAPGGNLQLRIEIAGQNSFSGGNQSITLASDDGLGVNAPTPDEIASVLFQLNVFLDETGAQPEWKLQGVVTFFDDADAELGTITTAVKTATGSLLAAIEGNNPLTGGDGGLAYGVSITDWGSGDANRFTGEWDYLELYGPPTVAIENPVALLAEDTDLSQSVKVADISASGTGVDVSALSLSGEDAASFIIVDNSGALELHVAAETDIDFETIGSLDVTVVATNSAGSTSSDLALPIGDVNEAPSITLEDVVTVISEDADTTSSTKVATILVEDDALGAEVLALTGEDAGLFEIVDNNGVQELRLISGVELSDETNPALDVSVTVDDATVGSGVDDTVQLTLAVLDGDDTPTVDQGIATQAVDQDALYSFTVPADAFADDGGVENLSFTASLADDSALPEWLDFDPLTQTFSGTPGNDDVGGPITVKVTATDVANQSTFATFDLSVNNINDAPTIEGDDITFETNAGSSRVIDLSGLTIDDVDEGDVATLVATLGDGSPLPDGLSLGPNGDTLLVGETLPQNEYVVRLVANDGEADSEEAVLVNISVGEALSTVRIEAEDTNTVDSTGFLLKTNKPGASGDGWIAAKKGADRSADFDLSEVAPGQYNVIIGYIDEADGESFGRIEIDGQNVGEWTWDNDADSNNGTVTGNIKTVEFSNIEVGEGSTLNLLVEREGSEGGAIDYVEFVPYQGDSQPPETDGIDDARVEIGEDFSINLADFFTNPDGPEPIYEITSVLPNWLTFDENTGELSGTPAAGDSGATSVTVKASDSVSSIEITFEISVPIDLPVRIQAEDFDSADNKVRVLNTATADEQSTIGIKSNNTGEIVFDLGKVDVGVGSNNYPSGVSLPPDVYNIRLVYFDENDGESTATVNLNGQTFSWTWDDDGGGPGPQTKNIREQIFTGFELGNGGDDILTITIDRDANETGRLDYIEIFPANASNGAPFIPFEVPDQSAPEDAAFSLNLADFWEDPEEEVLEFSLENGPEWLDLAADGTVTGTPAGADEGDATVNYTVTDGVNTVTGSFQVAVTPVNDAPDVVAPRDPETFLVGDDVNIDLASIFSDEEGDELTFTIEGDLPPGLELNEAGTAIEGEIEDGTGSYEITVTADDGTDETPSTFVINVLTNIDTETIEAEDFTLQSGFFTQDVPIASGTEVIRLQDNSTGEATYTIDGMITEASYDLRVSYFDESDGSGSASISISTDGGTTFTPLGTINFDNNTGSSTPSTDNLKSQVFEGVAIAEGTIIKIEGASDGNEALAIDKIDLVPVGDGNFAPIPDEIDDTTVFIQDGVSIDISTAFTDPDDDDLTYEVTSGQEWLSVVDGILVGTPPAVGDYVVTVSATDGVENSGITVDTTFTLTVDDDNLPPTVVPLGTLNLVEDQLIELPTAFTDPEGGPLTYRLSDDAPAWASINALGVLQGTPTQADVDAGPVSFGIIATDQWDAETVDTVQVIVANVNDAPEPAAPIADQAVDGGQPFSFTVSVNDFTDEDDAAGSLTLSATLDNGDPLPDWMAFLFDPNTDTGTFFGVAPTFQDISVTVTAADPSGAEGTQTFAVTSGEFVDNRPALMIEAESFDGLTAPFSTVAMADASNGELAGVTQDTTASMNTNIGATGAAGFYTAAVSYLDETDGTSTARLLVDGNVVGEWTFDGVSGSQVIGGTPGTTLEPGNLREITFDTAFLVSAVSVLTLEVTSEGSELARVDKVTLNPTSPPPAFASESFSVDENQTTVGLVEVLPEADTFAIAGDGADNALFSIDDDGNLAFVGAPDFENAGDANTDNVYEVSIDATNASGTTNETIEVTVADVNEAPTLTVTPVLTELLETADTTTSTKIADIVVDDDALGSFTLSLTGDDADLFSIVTNNDALELHLIAGATLDASENGQLDVNVEVDDPTIGDSVVEASEAVSVTVTDGTPQDQVVLRINSWGPTVAATDDGPDWQADGFGSPNNQYLTTTDSRGDTQGYSGDTGAIPDGVPQTVLDTARSSNAPFSYDIPVADIGGPGTYRVVLYIAELFTGAQAGNFRIFDASVEGGIPLEFDNIDPGAAFGADVGVLSAEVTVEDGELNIGLLQDAIDGIQNPIVNAVEIIKVGVPSDDTDAPSASMVVTNPPDADSPLVVEITLTDASGINATTLGAADLELSVGGFAVAADVTFNGFDSGVASYSIAAPDGGWTDGSSVDVTLKAGEIADNATPTNFNAELNLPFTVDIGGGSVGGGESVPLLRINAWGAEVAAIDGGPNWLADGNGSPDSTFLTVLQSRGDTQGYSGDQAAIPSDVPLAVLNTARSSNDPFSYNIPVTELNGNGNYTVSLFLAELFAGNQVPGSRVFDVAIEGQTFGVLNDIDPASLGSGADVSVVDFDVAVTDGELNIEFLQDLVDNPIINAIEVSSFSGTIDPPPGDDDPADALAVLENLDDVDDNGSYANGDVGSAKLSIIPGGNNVQTSNFGSNSFVLENTGDKQIAAVFLDFRNALYGDSVVDFDGSGGDTAAKPFQAENGAGATGAFFDNGETYYFPGDDPLPNNTGAGQTSSGGFRGLLLKFDGSSGGFTSGESVGFSGDMDPNSVAGLVKSIIDGGAVNSWDVGGVSGAELIGSAFTILFDDGSTALGYLGSDGSQAGSVGTAVQDRAEKIATVTVNGASATGTYGGTVPEIIVSGDVGDTVLVTLTKGLNPVTNNSGGTADLVEARLQDAQPFFQASNAADFQTFEVVIGADGTATVPASAFDYSSPDGGQFFNGTAYTEGYETAPIAVAVSVVDDNDGTPLGPVDRVYLTSNGLPVEGGGNAGVEGFFEGIDTGPGFRFKVQVEDANIANGGTDPGGKWNFVDAQDGDGNQSGFQGDGYYLFGSSTSTAINGANANELLEYDIFVPEGEEGIYDFRFRVSRDGDAAGDQQNDIWLNFKEADQPGNGDIEAFLTETTDEAEPTSNGAIKVFGGPNNGSWGFASGVDGLPGNFPAQIEITESGLYTVQIYGRSQGFHVDYWELYKGGNPGVGASNSNFVEGEPGDGGGNNNGDTLTFAIDSGADDWEESGAGGSNDLELGDNGGQQYVGLRFDEVTVPGDRTIAEAYVEFEALESSSGGASFDILIEDSENAAVFSIGNPPGGRDFSSDQFLWNNVESWTAGETYRTPDISELIEDVIGADGIVDGALSFLIDGNSGSRVAHTFESSGEAATLVIVLEPESLI